MNSRFVTPLLATQFNGANGEKLQHDRPQSASVAEAGQEATGNGHPGDEQQVQERVGEDEDVVTGAPGAEDHEAEDSTSAMNGDYNANLGVGSGDYNQMQMMMAMQNGMNPNAFSGFPMMSTSFPAAI